MKKVINMLLCLGLAACTSTHKGTKSLNVTGFALHENPMEVTVVPGEKISGTAECKSILGITYSSPGKEAYGAKLDTTSGNHAVDKCTRGAIYEAIVSSNADIILSPQYRSTKHGFLCLPYIGCFYSHDLVTVTGYKGTYKYTSPALQGGTGAQYTVQQTPVVTEPLITLPELSPEDYAKIQALY